VRPPNKPPRPDPEDEREHQQFLAAVRDKNFPKIASTFAAIDRNSRHLAADRKIHDQIRDQFIADMRVRAERAAAAGRCDDVERLARQAAGAWAEAGEAVKKVTCEQPPTRPRPPSAADESSPENLNREGETLLAQGKPAQARRLFQQAFRADSRGLYLVNLCRAHKAQGNRRAAIATCRRVSRARSTPDDIEAARRILAELEQEQPPRQRPSR
jgi:tetratricopeptide (TPR) repeat protein